MKAWSDTRGVWVLVAVADEKPIFLPTTETDISRP